MELTEFKMQVVNRVPEKLEFGSLYVCFDCNVVIHLCACGCGEKVVLPIAPEWWSVFYDGETISIEPSIGNFQFPCRSHYWIRKNKLIWADDFNQVNKKQPKHQIKKRERFIDRLKKIFFN